RDVVGQDVDEIERVRRRLDSREVELGDFSDRLQDRGQLLAHPLELLVGQLQPRQPRHVDDVFSRYRPLVTILAERNGPLSGPVGHIRKGAQAAWTLAACRPLSPCTISNSTR